MKRRLFTILSVLSLLLFVAVVVMWVRSYGVEADRWWYQFDYAEVTVVSAPGRVLVKCVDYNVDARDSWAHSWSWGGFLFWQTHLNDTSDYMVQAPYWALAALAITLPLCVAARLLWRKRTKNADQCSHCGYDLRATPERCPECGESGVEATAQRRKYRRRPNAAVATRSGGAGSAA